MALTLKQLKDVCLLHGGSKQCRFLRADDNEYDKYYCMKKRPTERKKIDTKVNQFINDCLKKKKDPHKETLPIGDNCSGYPILKHVPQGYDVP
jgi:hypothetical protein